MAPLNENQLEQKRMERKAQIMKAALKVFADNGVKLTKISMIAKEAGVSHGLVYHYFTSKDEVLYESLEWAMERNRVDQVFHELNESQLSPLEKIKQFTIFGFTQGELEVSSDIFRVVQHLAKSNENDMPDNIYDLVKKSGQFYIESLFPLFAEGQKSGEIIQGDTEELLEIYLTVISGIMADDPTWWRENMDQKVDILLRMITAR
ncbi:AcrR family transcriptional regulator [Virgibacillus natechei]|uniref:AcrR family transcriptional regulator n=1 Tax=Virgibacillus natechei TaxID=1216297 RepID=A0ABS4IBR3_9BACI|nr:TetR/AcrR family transcriptional regulator [Virgibacillus natechei]MBP1968365.1 AcrR family transcriptional regulator [Virgibacillus natechei]UZD13496.1 TetR/AcrR family transcriptional regulator [Virgibacillus natechei]